MVKSIFVFSQNIFLEKIDVRKLDIREKPIFSKIKDVNVFRIKEKSLENYLSNAPLEFSINPPIPLTLPLPDGSEETFNMVESPILSPEIALQNPEIKTYTGNGTKDKKRIIRLSITSEGFNAIFLNINGDTVYLEKYTSDNNNIYASYFTKNIKVTSPINKSCHIEDIVGNNSYKTNLNSDKNYSKNLLTTSGTQLRTFRIAIAATGEFTTKYGSSTAALATIVAYLNRLNAVYRNELSVAFTLVSGTNLIYTNPSTDPYSGDDISMISQNHINCNTVIGTANYDIGHLLHTDIPGSSGSGVASAASICDNSYKGSGISAEGDLNAYAQIFMDQLLFHEIGHQFGMSHSYNSNIPVCTTRAAATSVEPGSGASIMSYGFTCGTDDYYTNQTAPISSGPILQFHKVNFDQAISTIDATSCAVITATGNTPPVITMPSSYTVPKSTPFSLTGSATDADGDTLSYCWEGGNTGTVAPPTTSTLADTSQPPFFRTYLASTSPTRIYPILSKILNGTNYDIGDKLPSVSVTTSHSLTVRDNRAGCGGITNANVDVIVNGLIGPFLETTNLSGSYIGNTSQTITWSVNGTNIATPNVSILFSSDGGLTFPTTLIASTPNDGSESIILPNINTTQARIKVQSVGNIFFDISNTNFSITSGTLNTNEYNSTKDYTILYPNPNNGIFTIKFESSVIENSKISLKVYDASGKLLRNMDNLYSKNRKLKIDISDLDNGMYTLGIVVNNQLNTKKILIQKK